MNRKTLKELHNCDCGTDHHILESNLVKEAIHQAKNELDNMRIAEKIKNNNFFIESKTRYDYLIWFYDLKEKDFK